ncbi:MAG: hypothetical protein A4E19_01405 [Nitrospira sp. SG-bin1]|nr:MAG: hypothetical protein A4E19_01405 [Nitrospira sp. SG-bin1]
MVQCSIKAVEFSRSAADFVASLPRALKKTIGQAIRELALNPFLGIQLKGRLYGLRKRRVGDYRILYHFTETTLKVVDVGDRKDIYR